ncbi:MAG: pantetheine-phosphate adenylyltransferase [Candidatus Thermoplasmatota archaeon]|nr:pantetheine-phosphate adenylyltransferase [Candidatus Thermoplasmatota archaeon]
MPKEVIVGGTFDNLHLGHQKLLRKAVKEGRAIIGLVSDEMLEEWKPGVENSFEERKRELKNFLSAYEGWSIVEIDDPFGMAVENDFDTLVVSYETRERGEKINELRKEKGRDPLEIIEVKPVLADDLLPIKSTRIREGEIDREGKRSSAVKVHLGSENPVKEESAREVLSEYFRLEMVTEKTEGLSEQPFDEEIIEGARKRAEVPDDFDYGVGIESGIVETDSGTFSLEYVVIKDKFGFTSMGHGPGFPVPEDWVRDLKGGIKLGRKIEVVFEEEENKEKMGAVGLLTQGKVERKDCISSACYNAMIPRLNAEIYY